MLVVLVCSPPSGRSNRTARRGLGVSLETRVRRLESGFPPASYAGTRCFISGPRTQSKMLPALPCRSDGLALHTRRSGV